MTGPRVLPDHQATRIHPVKLAHIVLRASDLSRSRDWYMKVLEARPAFENSTVCFLMYDDEHHRIGLIARPDLSGSSDDRPGLEHIAFTYGSLGELLATYRRLATHGIEPYWSINHGPTISLYYKDPDGNRLELQYDVFQRAEDLDAFFASGAYADNFMGVRFVPEELIARFEAGEPIEQITARPPLAAGTTPWDMFVA
ncbi:VOC family protein [Variovorax guangxiensis]|uniref:VOC family protein n=1 Tax=Variovorax guangxiensis TaxID=1775474 RepID=UPI00285C9C74|nr:VOC family protein [Variovorax guangxiensis]MDR6860395.1 catechol-2,3-dioxygenase [Variovorax guangxiensis]